MLSLLFALTIAGAVNALDTGVGKLPVLAYDTYNALNGGVNSTITLAQAKAMSKLGLVDAGYNIYILDDFYLEPHRDAKGNLKVNTTLFPGGMKHWTNQVNKYNISVGAYSSNGLRTCAGNPAAYGNEVRDLETWRSWGYEKMLKYDNCYIPYDNLTQENEYGRFKRMQDAILQVAAKHNEDPWMDALAKSKR